MDNVSNIIIIYIYIFFASVWLPISDSFRPVLSGQYEGQPMVQVTKTSKGK